jgi:hypothetical protein
MFRWFRKKSLRLPRLAVMTLLALGLLAQSILDLSGQTHDAVLHADAEQAYVHHHAHGHGHGHDLPLHHDLTGTDPSPPESRDTLHEVLLHQPCAGHCFWVAGDQVALLPGEVVATRIGSDATGFIHSADRSAPFRPPIRA